MSVFGNEHHVHITVCVMLVMIDDLLTNTCRLQVSGQLKGETEKIIERRVLNRSFTWRVVVEQLLSPLIKTLCLCGIKTNSTCIVFKNWLYSNV